MAIPAIPPAQIPDLPGIEVVECGAVALPRGVDADLQRTACEQAIPYFESSAPQAGTRTVSTWDMPKFSRTTLQ